MIAPLYWLTLNFVAHENLTVMKSATLLFALSFALLSSSCSGQDHSSSEPEKKVEMETPSPKTIAKDGMDAIFRTHDLEAVNTLLTDDYIQHNPGVPTGKDPILGFVPILKESGTTFKTHRVIQDGNLVAMHNTYDNAQPFGAEKIVSFDVFRIENGKLAEHWDCINPIAPANSSGRLQYDGATEITDLDKTEANKTLVKNFIDDILFGKNPDKMTEYISTEEYLQHNSAIADGLDGLGAALEYLASQNDMFQYEKVHRVIGEGNFVLTVSEGMWHGKKQAFYDLFRIDNSKIVEHWDVIQEVPAEMAHNNGMF